MKPKQTCKRCGRYVASKKFKKSRLEDIYICPACYLSENYKRFKGTNYDNMVIIPENEKNALRMAENAKKTQYLNKDDIEFIKSKYNNPHLCKNKIKQINKFNYIAKNRISNINKEKIKNIEKSKELNNNFLNNLK